VAEVPLSKKRKKGITGPHTYILNSSVRIFLTIQGEKGGAASIRRFGGENFWRGLHPTKECRVRQLDT